MPKDYRVTRDQAVWERETFYITVPEDVPEAEHEEWIYEYIASGEVKADSVEIEGGVDMLDTEVTIHPH